MTAQKGTRGSYVRRVHSVMDYVRGHLSDDLSLGVLAKVAHFSPHHFHRIFRAAAGETVTAFTQRARLERAAYLMKASPERMLGSIALEVGFSEHSAFSRVFKQRYGIAPTTWDRRSRLQEVGLEGMAAEKARARKEDDPPIARVVERAPCRVAYVRMRTPFFGDTLKRGYEQLVHWLEQRDYPWRQSQLLGLSWDNYETTPLDQVRFDFGLTVSDDIVAEDEVGVHVLPAMRTVEVHCVGPLRRIAVAWDYLYDEWFPSSGYEPDDLPAIKRFRRRPDELDWKSWDVDCSIALRQCVP